MPEPSLPAVLPVSRAERLPAAARSMRLVKSSMPATMSPELALTERLTIRVTRDCFTWLEAANRLLPSMTAMVAIGRPAASRALPSEEK